MQYYIGLDNGGTTTKAALFDSRGKQLGCCSVATKALTLRPEFVERDMEEMWEANCQVVRGGTGTDEDYTGRSSRGRNLRTWKRLVLVGKR